MAACISVERDVVLCSCLLVVAVFLQRLVVSAGQPFPPGSCLAAGHTECCHDGCLGQPETCLCDPSCRDFGDCCSDFHLTCNPERDAALEQLRPVVTFVQDRTFHTVSLRWVVAGTADDQFSFNGSYSVTVAKVSELASATEQNISRQVPILSSVERREYVLRLDGLDEDAHYEFSISTITSVKILDNPAQGAFSTLRYSVIENLKLEVKDDSSVRAMWLPPAVPVGVHILGFKVFFHRRHTLAGDNETNGAQMVQTLQPDVTVGGLSPGRVYKFEVVGVYQEADGTVHEGRREGNSSDVFVPDSSIFQLVAKLYMECRNWNMQCSEAVLSSLRAEVVESIQSSCNCPYPEKNLREETLASLCSAENEDEPFIQVTYRARLLGTAEHRADDLIGHVDARRYTSQAVPLQINHTHFSMVLSSAERCPTRLDFKAASLCGVQTENAEEEHSPSNGNVVSRQTLINALVAEFVSMTTLFILVALATTCFMVARRRWQGSKVRRERSEGVLENHYRERPSIKEGDAGGEEMATDMNCRAVSARPCPSPPSYNQVMGSCQSPIPHEPPTLTDNEQTQDIKEIL